MRFKLDENLPRELADDLRRLGHDPDSIVEEGLSGAKDRTVLQAARTAGRVLLTAGRRAVSSFVRARLSALLEMELAGRLTVVGSTRIRAR